MGMPSQPELGIGYGTAQQFSSDPLLGEGASRYARANGRLFRHDGLDTLQVDPMRGYQTFHDYHQRQRQEPSSETVRSYGKLRGEVADQYDFLTGHRPAGLGVKVEVTPEDPYPSPEHMARDVAEQGRLKVMSTATTGGHSFFTNEENDKFRAVHDAFGHLAIGRGFSRHGEEAAYRAHRQMFSPDAVEALTSETRGQNSYLNYNNLGEEFPENAVVGMSPESQSLSTPKRYLPPRPAPQGEQLRLF
jgi:hypothetical protein